MLDHRSDTRRRPGAVQGDAADAISVACQGAAPGTVVVNGVAPAAGPNCELAGWKGKGAVAF